MTLAAQILVVDDDPGIREMLHLALGQSGHDVMTSDGQSPIEPGDAEVVLLDLRLGDRTAAEVLAESPELAHRAVVFVSAADEDEPSLEHLPLTPAAVLLKPFDLAALDAAIEQATAAARSRQPATSSGPGTRRG